MDPTTLISARNLTKRYGDLVAVDSVSFDIRKGECFGLLGPNGAGKTTTIKMISCLSPITGGELWVGGKSVDRDQRAIKSGLGIVSQSDSLDPDLSVLQNLIAYSRFFNIPKATAMYRAWEALRLFQLESKVHERPDHLSGGMRRRLLIARALLNKPAVLVLDEPTTGLDPQTRHLVWSKLRELKAQGITILLTTHYMEEATYLCDRLVVMDMGSILVEGEPGELVRSHVGERVVEIHAPHGDKAALFDVLNARGVAFEDAGLSVYVYDEDGFLSDDRIAGNGYQVVRRPANLEDVFLRLTGRGLREE